MNELVCVITGGTSGIGRCTAEAMGKWLYANGEQYGWSLSFPQGYEDVTGYRWECWHFRYIGKEA